MLLNRVEQLKSVILQNKSYEDFIDYLNELNAPINNFDLFVHMFVNLYVEDDFFAILAIIDNNMDKFNEFNQNNIVFREIIREIMEDYVESKITQ